MALLSVMTFLSNIGSLLDNLQLESSYLVLVLIISNDRITDDATRLLEIVKYPRYDALWD